MGWALQNLSEAARERIARACFDVQSENGGWLNGLCPFHPDTTPSFGYNVTDDVFKCLGTCVDSGDLVDLWCLVNGYAARSQDGFKAFKRAHAEDMGLGAPQRKTPGQLAKAAQRTAAKECKQIPEAVYEVFGPIPDAMYGELRLRRGWNKETVEELGIRLLTHFRKKTDLYRPFPLKNQPLNRLVLPVRDEKSVLWNLRVYYPFKEDIPEEGAKIISWGKGHGSSRIFPSPALLRPGPIILAEGESDTVCGRSQGLINVFTQTSKTTHFPPDQLQWLAGRDVYLPYDADKPGQEYAHKAAKSLYKAGCKVRIIEWPDYMGKQSDGTWPDAHGQDLTDFFVKHHKTATDFASLMEKAPLYDPKGLSLPDDSEGDQQDYRRFWHHSVNGRWSFSERLLADFLIENNPMLYHDKSGQLYRWEGTYYEPWSEEQLKRAAIDALGVEAAASRVNSACSLVMSIVSMPHGRELNDRPEWVCLQNGMFNLYTLELVPHDPDFLSTIKLGVNWHGENTPKPKRWLAYLAQTIQTPEVIMQAQEYSGYCLTRQTKFGKSLLLYGPGADGKSKFIAVLRALVGPQNCSAVSMSGLDDQFQRAALFGKILNVATEITTDAIQSEMFKAVVTGDPIQASFKHKDSFEFVPYCKLVYATNKMPRVFDNSDGYFRRLLPIVFKRQFLEGDPDLDPDLEDKLMAELDGIFAWAVYGLHRIIEQKAFTTCGETLDFMMRYRRYNNPVMGFVQDRCSLEQPESETPLKDLYKAYKSYCTDGGFRAANRENFFEELNTACRKLNEDAAIRRYKPRRNGERPDLVSGVRLLQIVDGDFDSGLDPILNGDL